MIYHRRISSTAVLWIGGIALVDGLGRLGIWIATGDPALYYGFFRYEGALVLVAFPLAEVCFAALIQRRFVPGQLMYSAWHLIALSAVCSFVGAICAQLLGGESSINPLVLAGVWSKSAGETLRSIGLVLGGPCQFILLACGLSRALGTYREAGFSPRLSWAERILLTAVGLYVLDEAGKLGVALWHGKHPALFEVLNWPVDPVLCVLLAQAMLLRRAVVQTGIGLVGRCWAAFSAAISMTVAADAGIWATNYGLLPWPWSSVVWLVWIPATAAFALAPAYQCDAIWHAHTGHDAPILGIKRSLFSLS